MLERECFCLPLGLGQVAIQGKDKQSTDATPQNARLWHMIILVALRAQLQFRMNLHFTDSDANPKILVA